MEGYNERIVNSMVKSGEDTRYKILEEIQEEMKEAVCGDSLRRRKLTEALAKYEEVQSINIKKMTRKYLNDEHDLTAKE